MGTEQENLAAALLDAAIERGWGDKVALRESGRAWSYADLRDQVARVATALKALRLGRGDRVAVVMSDSLEATSAILGAVYAGMVAVPLSELARPSDLRDCLNDSGAAAAVVDARLEPRLDEVRGEVSDLREVLVVGGSGPGERDFRSLVRGAAPAPQAALASEDDIAFILYSAGARAEAPEHPSLRAGEGMVGIPHTHRAPLAAFESFGRGAVGLTEADRVFSVVRVSTAYGLGSGLAFPLAAGAEARLLSQQPRSGTVFKAIEEFDPTVIFATPSLFGQLARDAASASMKTPLTRVRACVAGAEDMPPKVIERVSQVLGSRVIVGYGLTEAFQFVMAGFTDGARPGACGKPVAGFESRIVDDDGRPVGVDEIGTLEIRGPTIARSYWGEDRRAAEPEAWFRTRDRFMRDGDGNYYHCGRADDLFKVSGKWVAPAEVERALLAHEAVWECAVVGVDDEDGLIKPLAFVVPNIGHDPGPALEDSLRGYVKSVLAPYKYPRWIEFVEALPKGPHGKVLRYKLRASDRPRRAITSAPE